MPNWCENDLKVTGKKSDVKKFVNFLKEKKQFFSRVIPYQPLFEDLDKLQGTTVGEAKADVLKKLKKHNQEINQFWTDKIKDWFGEGNDSDKPTLLQGFGYNCGGYNWSITNWGTKWDIDDYKLIENLTSGSVLVKFLTAWTPPIPIIKKLSEMFPEVTFKLKYYEGGMCFSGILVCKKGETIKDETYEYSGNRGG